MSFSAGLMRLGAFEQRFRALPHILAELVPGYTIEFWRGQSRAFAGVITEPGRREGDELVAAGAGPEWWLGEDDKKGPVREPVTYTGLRTDQIADNLLFRRDGTRALNPGIMHLGNVLASFGVSYETCRSAIQRLAQQTSTEYRVNPDFTFDWAGNGALFVTRNFVLSEGAGTARRVEEYEPSAFNAVKKVYALGAGEGDALVVATATATLPAEWKDWNNQPFQRDLVVDAPEADTAAEAGFVATAQAGLHGVERKKAEVELASDSLLSQFGLGDTVYVHKPLVLEDPTKEIPFRGAVFPGLPLRVTQLDVDPGPGWRVLIRKPDGTRVDRTDAALLADRAKVIVILSDNPRALYSAQNDPSAALREQGAVATNSRRFPQPLPIAIVSAQNIADGAVLLQKFGPGLRPVQVVSSLPALPSATYPQGACVFLTTDNKLYRSTGTAWTVAVPTGDLTGQITETQISDDSISTPKLQANSVTADEILAGSVGTDELAANSVVAGKIAAGAVLADKLVVGNFDNLAEDPGFEADVGSWGTDSAGWTQLNDVTNARTGRYSMRFDGTAVESRDNVNRIPCKAGDEFYIEGYIKSNGAGSAGAAGLVLRWGDVDNALISETATALVTTATSYTFVSVSGVAPAGAQYLSLRLKIPTAPAGGRVFYFDDIYGKRRVATAFLADLVVIGAKIADATISDAKIASLSADKIIAGTLQADVLIGLSGFIRTASSGTRAELGDDGLSFFTATAELSSVQRLDWWRDGTADTDPFAHLVGWWGSSFRNVALRLESAFSGSVTQEIRFEAEAGAELTLRGGDGATGTGVYWSAQFDTDNGSGEPVELFNAGLVYANGAEAIFSNIAGGGTSSVAATYAFPFKSAGGTVRVLLGTEDTSAEAFATYSANGLTGATIRGRNHLATTNSIRVFFCPVQ